MTALDDLLDSGWGGAGSGNVTRGEFVAVVKAIGTSLRSIEEHVGHIDERLNRPKRILLFAALSTVGKIAAFASAIAVTYLAAKIGVGPL
jgi:hypothetical protein